MIRRIIPKSIARQLQHIEDQEGATSAPTPEFVDVLVNGSIVKMSASELPTDLPSHKKWFGIRIWADELAGRSLTA